MKFTYLIIAALFLFTGCAGAPPVKLQAAAALEPIVAFATLSDSSNPSDVASSVVKTHLAGYLHLAAKKLRHGEIDIDYARFVRREAEEMHEQLSRAIAARDLAAIGDIAGRLDTDKINLELRNAQKN